MANREKVSQCCEVKSACGRSLWHGVVTVAITSLVVSSIALLVSLIMVGQMTNSKVLYHKQPTKAVDIVFGLVTIFISPYQLVLASLLLWQALRTKGNIFLCSVWYTSHLSILMIYFIMFFVRAFVYIKEKHYVSGAFTVLATIIYESIYIYFTIVVNSYLHALDLGNARYF